MIHWNIIKLDQSVGKVRERERETKIGIKAQRNRRSFLGEIDKYEMNL